MGPILFDLFYGQVSFFQEHSIEMSSGFCVAISTSRRFIGAIKQHYPMIFNFYFSKGPFDLGGSERYPKGMDWSKNGFEVFFLDLIAFPRHIKVRPKNSLIFHF